jgi:hypothetical protein
MQKTIAGTHLMGIQITPGIYDIRHYMETIAPLQHKFYVFPYSCPRKSLSRYNTRVFYILKAHRAKIAACPKPMAFSICEECYGKFTCGLASNFTPVFVNDQFSQTITCSSDSFIDPMDSMDPTTDLVDSTKFAQVNDNFIFTAEYKSPTDATWRLAYVDVVSTTLTVRVPVAECEFRLNVFSGLYSNDTEKITYTLDSISKTCDVLESLFKKDIYYSHENNNKITIHQTHFDKRSNTARSLKFTALDSEVTARATSMTSVSEITKQGHNRLQLCIHTAQNDVPVEPTQRTIHYGVRCDVCSQMPIVGLRTYCTMCDFDVCLNCCVRVRHTHKMCSSHTVVGQMGRLPYFPGAHTVSSIRPVPVPPAYTPAPSHAPPPELEYIPAPAPAPAPSYDPPELDLCPPSTKPSSCWEWDDIEFTFPAPAPAPAPASAPALAFPAAHASVAPTTASAGVLHTGAITTGSVQSNVTTHTVRVRDHRDILTVYIQIFCTNKNAVSMLSDKYMHTTVPKVAPMWGDFSM